MRIFRHRHTLVLLTLLAFALQGVIAVAHTHVHTSAPAKLSTQAKQDGALAMRAMTFGLCRPAADKSCPAPAQHDDRNCPICWSVNLAATAVLGLPPSLPALDAPIAIPSPPHSAALLLGAAAVHFQARGPPATAAV